MTVNDPRLQEALDGERDPATLPEGLRDAYARLTGAAELLRETPAVSVADRVMAEIRRGAPVPVVSPAGAARRIARWFTRPRAVTLRLRPAWTVAIAAALAAVVFLPFGPRVTPGPLEGVAQFVGHFPGARSVEVVGSFNDWRRGALALRDENNDGICRRPRSRGCET